MSDEAGRFVTCDEFGCVTGVMPFGTAEIVAKALRGAAVGTWHFDSSTGLTTWDEVASVMLGYEETVHISSGLGPVHPDDQDLLRHEVEQCLRNGKAYDVEFRAIRADGKVRWLHASSGPALPGNNEAPAMVGIVADITARKKADEKLRIAEERHLVVSRAASDLIYEWDAATGQMRWNEALATYFDCPSGDRHSIAVFLDKLHPEERDDIIARIRQAMDHGGSHFTARHRLQRTDGSYGEIQTSIFVIRNSAGLPARVVGALQDITERVRADAALRDSEAINRSIVEASTDVIKLLDLEGRLVFVNGPGATALKITDIERYYGKEWASLWPVPARHAVRQAVATACRAGIGTFSEACPTTQGELKWWDVVVSPVLGNDGQPTKLVAISRDITERKEAAERLAWSANHDALTNLPNRAYFQEALTKLMSQASAKSNGFALMLLDLDDFKQVNDTLGHDAGDAVLTTFAERLGSAIIGSATLARLGGDEFAILIENVANERDLRSRANLILQRMREPFVHGGRILDCRVTVGAALYPDHGETPDELLKSADIALYAAKTSDRGTLVLFEPRHRAQVQERLAMVSLARTAVHENRILPFYQPKVSLVDGTIHGFEALLRWYHPRLGIQLPATIAAAFEDLEVAAAISDAMIDNVIAAMRGWLDQGVAFGHVAVNAAAAEFRHDKFGESILERLARADVPPSCFHLEVTETVFLGRGAENVERALKLLDSAGVNIALDDFGTGYASLRHLKQFPVHVIKIDQSFVRDMNTDPEDAAIIEAVLNLGRSLKIDVVAEGIETEAQEKCLRDLGCRYGQGFLYSQAIPQKEVPNLIRLFGRAPYARRPGKRSSSSGVGLLHLS